MRRRSAIAIALSVLAVPFGVHAQARPRVIGALGLSNRAVSQPFNNAFLQELAKLGWVDGRNVVLRSLYADGNVNRLDSLASELVAQKPDVLFAVGDPTSLALQRATREIPIVFAAASNPLALGLVKSLARPEANITGFAANAGPEIVGKRLQLLRELVPNLTQLAILVNPDEPGNQRILENYRKHSAEAGITLSEFSIRNLEDVDREFLRIAKERPQAMYVLHSSLTFTHLKVIASRLAVARMPTMCSVRTMAEGGLLLSYAIPVDEYSKNGARYVDRILRGAKPTDLPVEQPTKLELVVNLQTAKEMDFAVPKSILLRADRVIE